MPELPEPRPKQKRLTKEEKEEVAKALKAGKKATDLAGQYGVSRQAISLIKRRMDAEKGDKKAAEVRERRLSKLQTMKLTDGEWEKLTKKLKSSTPLEHKFTTNDDSQPRTWDLERATLLARKLFNRTPARTRIIKLLQELFPDPKHGPAGKPQPPTRITRDTISPEFRDDPSYVKYVTSETYWKIQQRTYEIELAEWERRQAGLPPRDEEDDEDEPFPPMDFPMPPPQKRKKGSPFTKPKRRKKKKRK